jgi:hypothetical protein
MNTRFIPHIFLHECHSFIHNSIEGSERAINVAVCKHFENEACFFLSFITVKLYGTTVYGGNYMAPYPCVCNS